MRLYMNVRAIAVALTLLFSFSAFSAELDTCIKTVLSKPKLYRLEKEESIKSCFELNKANIDQDTCFEKAKDIKNWVHSTQLQNQMLSTCFYDTKPFKSVAKCTAAARNFPLASDHDEAIFYCYQIFQENLNQNQCVDIADKMIFPLKKDYLKRHCLQN